MTLEPFGDLAGVEPAVREEPQQQSGVDRPGAGGHDDAVEWREAHRGVYGSPVDDGAERRAAAEVAGHGAGAAGKSCNGRAAGGGPGVREAMEPEPIEVPPLSPRARQGVRAGRSGEHTSALPALPRRSYSVLRLKNKKYNTQSS